MTIKTEKLHVTAAAIVESSGGKEFIVRSGRPAALRRYLLNTLCDALVQETGCAPQTARRHIRAALGLIAPIGARSMRTALPVQSLNFRATDAEWGKIRKRARAVIKKLLAEVRAKKDD